MDSLAFMGSLQGQEGRLRPRDPRSLPASEHPPSTSLHHEFDLDAPGPSTRSHVKHQRSTSSGTEHEESPFRIRRRRWKQVEIAPVQKEIDRLTEVCRKHQQDIARHTTTIQRRLMQDLPSMLTRLQDKDEEAEKLAVGIDRDLTGGLATLEKQFEPALDNVGKGLSDNLMYFQPWRTFGDGSAECTKDSSASQSATLTADKAKQTKEIGDSADLIGWTTFEFMVRELVIQDSYYTTEIANLELQVNSMHSTLWYRFKYFLASWWQTMCLALVGLILCAVVLFGFSRLAFWRWTWFG